MSERGSESRMYPHGMPAGAAGGAVASMPTPSTGVGGDPMPRPGAAGGGAQDTMPRP